ncbi:hypothetical protein SS05631_c33060 [Sinorhizobium sp. CCBAU 05631]|nr:hypothetical protein SS05631_c33060 [Sinorhizobium sp. CCBAU 05631]
MPTCRFTSACKAHCLPSHVNKSIVFGIPTCAADVSRRVGIEVRRR